MDDYAAIVDRSRRSHTIVDLGAGAKPYWSTTGPDGKKCWVSVSGGDKVVVIDYATAAVLAEIPVGDHPQRVREGVVPRSLAQQWARPAAAARPGRRAAAAAPAWTLRARRPPAAASLEAAAGMVGS